MSDTHTPHSGPETPPLMPQKPEQSAAPYGLIGPDQPLFAEQLPSPLGATQSVQEAEAPVRVTGRWRGYAVTGSVLVCVLILLGAQFAIQSLSPIVFETVKDVPFLNLPEHIVTATGGTLHGSAPEQDEEGNWIVNTILSGFGRRPTKTTSGSVIVTSEGLAAGKDGQVLMSIDGQLQWVYLNTSTGSGSTGSGSNSGGGDTTNNNVTIINTGGTGGIAGVFVGVTEDAHAGTLTSGGKTGYAAAHELCNQTFAGSHMCGMDEILHTIATQDYQTLFEGKNGAWVSDGAPGYISNTNDCRGWTSSANVHLAPWWEFDGERGGIGFLTNCYTTFPLACCI